MYIFRKELIFLVILYLIHTLHGQVDVNDINCQYERLPETLNSISYLDFNGEFHTHGEYFANFSARDQRINFVLNQQSAFRIYVAAHDVDIDLWLYNTSSGYSIGRSSLDVGVEEVIQQTLPAGSYYVKLSYFGVLIGNYHPGQCDTVEVELQIVPISVINTRTPNFQCSAIPETLPFPHWGPLASGDPVSYNSFRR